MRVLQESISGEKNGQRGGSRRVYAEGHAASPRNVQHCTEGVDLRDSSVRLARIVLVTSSPGDRASGRPEAPMGCRCRLVL